MKVFVSSCELADSNTRSLIGELQARDIQVSHSPSPQPANWYADGLRVALQQADACVSVLTPTWEVSSWMQLEAMEGLKAFEAGEIIKFCYFNPIGMVISAAGMTPLLLDKLPDEADRAAEEIVSFLT